MTILNSGDKSPTCHLYISCIGPSLSPCPSSQLRREISSWRLNDISRLYSQEDTGGIVCSYALTKCFKYISPEDVLSESSSKYQTMIETFKGLIEYHQNAKFDEFHTEIQKGLLVDTMDSAELTRYILKRAADPLFGLDMKTVASP